MAGARGGVYLGGGLVAKLADFLHTSPLRRRFDERGDLSAYVKAIPVHLITQPEPGLLGASHKLGQAFCSVALSSTALLDLHATRGDLFWPYLRFCMEAIGLVFNV